MPFIVPPTSPPALARTTFLPPTHLPSSPRRGAPVPLAPALPGSPAANAVQDWLRELSARVSASAGAPRRAPREYRTMSAAPSQPDLAALSAVVVQVRPVCPARDHVQLTLDVSAAGLCAGHVVPGQFVQLAREMPSSFARKRGRRVCFATIASPPGGCDGCFEFLVAAANDPLKLATLKPGEKIAISPVVGKGLDYLPVVQSSGDLYFFVDAPQGFAAAKSLIEWGQFRSASGEGANRTNHITVYYAVPTGKSLPYADRFSAWSVYGVNVVPLAGVSVLEYLSTRSSVGQARRGLTADFAIGCVASDETYESLFCSLILFGFRRTAIQKFTQEVVAQHVLSFDASQEWQEVPKQEGKPSGMPEDVYQQMKRDSVEREIWQSWVRVREGMRAEFERKWSAQAKMDREARRSEAEKQQAWASWCAHNSSQWSQVAWDNDQWGQYWSSWRETQDSWTAKNGSWQWGGSSSGNSGSSGSENSSWSQQNSQEYWDWVGRGSGAGKSSSSSRNGSTSDSDSWYDRAYGGSESWGNANNRWSGYQKGGYRYEYEAPKEDKSSKKSGASGGARSGSGSGWSGWNRNTSSGWRSKSSGSKRNWNTSKNGTFGDLDFYGVLGIDSGASRADIKKAYRRKAMEHHPDHNPGKSEEAHFKMKQIVVAWSVLKDEDKRKKYDSFGPAGL